MPAAQKPAKNGPGFALGATDYVEIQQLVARYGYALDTAADQGEAFARLFTPDGVFRAKTGHPFAAGTDCTARGQATDQGRPGGPSSTRG